MENNINNNLINNNLISDSKNKILKMNEITKINAPEGVKYLGQFMDEHPVNCLFNKGTTNCGGTDLALSNNKNTIIAMPFISVVDNKSESNKFRGKVLGVKGSTDMLEIEDYIKNNEV